MVTGGTSGIGAAISEHLAETGYVAVINYNKDRKGAVSLKKRIQSAGGIAEIINADIRREAEVNDMFRFIDSIDQQMVGLVNNASFSSYEILQDFEDLDLEELNNMFAVNVIGAAAVSKMAVSRMKQTEMGSIVNITSQATKLGGRGIAHYATTKGALATLTKSMANQLGKFNIRVNSVSPGLIRTDNNKALNATNEESLAATIPIGRIGEPIDVAKTVKWLISEDSGYITGTCIEVSGGR